ncbi:MAG: AsmA-like C-terminal region-containing protein, partial [Pseudomonadota bacterium]
ADVAAELSFPLLRKLTPAQVSADVEATLRDVTVGLPTPLPIRAARLTLDATQKRMEVRGPLQIGPAQAQFAWTQVFRPEPGTPGGRMTAQLALTPALLASLGARLPPEVLTGPPAPARVSATLEKGRTRFALDADLVAAVLAAPGTGWRKPAGVPGRLQLSGQLQGGLTGRLTLDGIALTAGELRVSGEAVLGPQRQLLEAHLTELRLGDVIDSSLIWDGEVLRLKGGVLDLSALGRLLQDVSPQPLSEPAAAPPDAPAPGAPPAPSAPQAPPAQAAPRRIEIDIDRLVVAEAIVLTPATGTLIEAAPGQPFLTLSGTARGGAPVELAFTRAERGLTVRLTSSDAGLLLRGAGYFDGAYGGRLVLDLGMAPGSDALTGRLVIRRITIRDAPILGEMLSVASITGIFEQLTTGGLTFDRVEAQFARADGTLYLTEGRATGGSLGITIAGSYDEVNDRVSLAGVFSPAYLFNGLLGEVPVLGTVLTGRRGEGVFGFSYEVSGTPEKPSVSVNPLSILAPGVLRGVLTKEAPVPPADLGPALPAPEADRIEPDLARPAIRSDREDVDR